MLLILTGGIGSILQAQDISFRAGLGYDFFSQEFLSNQQAFRKKEIAEDENKTVAEQEEKEESELAKVEEMRGSPMGVGTLEEIIDDNHAIISSTSGPEYYVSIMSFVDKDMIEPGCTVLLHHKVLPFTLHHTPCGGKKIRNNNLLCSDICFAFPKKGAQRGRASG